VWCLLPRGFPAASTGLASLSASRPEPHAARQDRSSTAGPEDHAAADLERNAVERADHFTGRAVKGFVNLAADKRQRHEGIHRFATVQKNFDYSSEADMVKKLRLSLALQPVATAMFANSPFTEGKPFLSFRSEIWRDTDADRCGRRSSLVWVSSVRRLCPRACRGIERLMKLSLDIDPPEPLGAVAPQGRLPEDIGRLDYAFSILPAMVGDASAHAGRLELAQRHELVASACSTQFVTCVVRIRFAVSASRFSANLRSALCCAAGSSPRYRKATIW
jgi:glutamate-cysteine ligase